MGDKRTDPAFRQVRRARPYAQPTPLAAIREVLDAVRPIYAPQDVALPRESPEVDQRLLGLPERSPGSYSRDIDLPSMRKKLTAAVIRQGLAEKLKGGQ